MREKIAVLHPGIEDQAHGMGGSHPDQPVAHYPLAPRPASLRGKQLVILENSKPNAK